MTSETHIHASESHCGNGGCTRPVYRAHKCYRCWIGMKWWSLTARLRNASGNCNSYVGIPLGFTRKQFIAWGLSNVPPNDMECPSIDRIIPQRGYVPGNIRWWPMRKNIEEPNRDLPDSERCCSICHGIFPATNEYFPRTRKGGKPALSSFCKPCNRIYQNKWSHTHG